VLHVVTSGLGTGTGWKREFFAEMEKYWSRSSTTSASTRLISQASRPPCAVPGVSPTGGEFGTDQRQPRAAEHAVRIDDHETAVMRQARVVSTASHIDVPEHPLMG
jgi:hypothetical protein